MLGIYVWSKHHAGCDHASLHNYLIKDLTAFSTSDSAKPSKLFLTSLPFSNLAVMLGRTPNDSLIKIGNL